MAIEREGHAMADGDEAERILEQEQQSGPPAKSRPSASTIVLSIMIGALLFVSGVAVGTLMESNKKDSSVAAGPTTTIKKSAISEGAAPTDPPPTEAPTTAPTTAAPYTPVPTDFQLEVVELERSCFGSAGCNIVFRVNPSYVGAEAPSPSKSFTVTYDLQGGKAPESGSFTIRNGQASTDSEDSTQVPPGGSLIAVPTRVLPN